MPLSLSLFFFSFLSDTLYPPSTSLEISLFEISGDGEGSQRLPEQQGAAGSYCQNKVGAPLNSRYSSPRFSAVYLPNQIDYHVEMLDPIHSNISFKLTSIYT